MSATASTCPAVRASTRAVGSVIDSASRLSTYVGPNAPRADQWGLRRKRLRSPRVQLLNMNGPVPIGLEPSCFAVAPFWKILIVRSPSTCSSNDCGRVRFRRTVVASTCGCRSLRGPELASCSSVTCLLA